MADEAVIIIPARWESSRFPGKPLAKIGGQTMLERVWRIARAVPNASCVWVATDDERILKHAQEIGAQAVMTSAYCASGTQRVWEAAQKLNLKAGIYVNLQGDAPLTPPEVLEALINRMIRDPQCSLATPAIRLDRAMYDTLRRQSGNGKASATTVTFDKNGRALYFSKAVIPHIKKKESPHPNPLPKGEGMGNLAGSQDNFSVYEHLGVYAYRREALEKWVSLPPGQFELAEELEQLRVLEHGLSIQVVITDTKGRPQWSVDNPEDIAIVEGILREGVK